jgi:glycosyltransferase involved in cell wall biosynthesis
MPSVSVIIPTFNRSQTLRRAVDSVLRQSFRDFELIIVDDGSQDETITLLSSIRDPRIKVLSQLNHGVSHARNRGIEASRGDLICFLDSDDAWCPNKLARQIDILKDDPRYQVIYTNEIWIRNGVRVNQKKKHRKYSGWIYSNCLPLCIISPSSVLMHRSIVEQENGFNESFPVCEDYELWLRIASKHPIYFLDELLIYKYGGHSDQLSRSRWGLDLFRIQAMVKMYESGRLTPYLENCTANEIIRKSQILIAGFLNRQKSAEADRFRSIERRFRLLKDSMFSRLAADQ